MFKISIFPGNEVQTKLGKYTEFSFCILVYSLKIIYHFSRKVVYDTTFPGRAPHQSGIIYHFYKQSGIIPWFYTTLFKKSGI